MINRKNNIRIPIGLAFDKHGYYCSVYDDIDIENVFNNSNFIEIIMLDHNKKFRCQRDYLESKNK